MTLQFQVSPLLKQQPVKLLNNKHIMTQQS